MSTVDSGPAGTNGSAGSGSTSSSAVGANGSAGSGSSGTLAGGVNGPRVVAIGETMAMMRSGTIGSLAHLPSVDISLGGAESNLAIGLRRLDVPVAWVSRVGDDPLGTRVTREIRAEGVAVHCAIDPTRPTGLMIKSRPTGTTTRVDYYRAGSAASALTPEDLPEGLIEQADVLHLSGITPLLSPSAHATNVAAVQRAAAAGTQVSLDVNYRSRLGSREHLAGLLGEILEHVDILFGGPEELSILAPEVAEDDHHGLLRALAADGRQVVAKLGPDGGAALAGGTAAAVDGGTGPAGAGSVPADAETARYAGDATSASAGAVPASGEIIEAPGHRVAVVDTVGAGDAFVAGYLSAQLDGLDVPARLARANACGALACTTPGDWEGAPRRPDLDALLAGGGADPVSR